MVVNRKTYIVVFIFSISLPAVVYVRNILTSIYLYVGSSDEGYQMLQVQGRNQEGVHTWYQPYLDILAPMWKISGENIKTYRILGISFFIITLSVSAFLLTKRFSVSLTGLLFFITACLSGLGISRYLLVTPGYQYLVLVGSVSSLLPLLYILIGRHDREIQLTPEVTFYLVVLSFFELIICSGRISSGLIFAFSLSLLLKLSLPRSILIKSLVIIQSPTLLVYCSNFSGWRDRAIFTVTNARIADPRGYSVVHEIYDVLFPVIPILTAYFVGSNWKCIKSKNPFNIINFVLLATFLITLSLGVNRFIFACISVLFYLIGRVIGASGHSSPHIPLIISLIPYLCVFGSNTPAAGNFHNLIIGATIVLIAYTSNNRDSLNLRIDSSVRKFLLLAPIYSALLLFYIGLTSESTGYGKDLNSTHHAVSRIETLESIYSLETKSEESSIELSKISGQSVLDLSFFNPGLIFYLGGNPYSLSLPGIDYLWNLQATLRNIEKIDFSKEGKLSQQAKYILVESDHAVDEECNPLNLYPLNLTLSNRLKFTTLNSRYRAIARFKIPNSAHKIVLLQTCNSEIMD
jgi:hypothetical protein